LTLFQNCNGNIRNYTDVIIGQAYDAILPVDYVGVCSFWTAAKGIYRGTSSNIINSVASPRVQIVSPGNSSSFNAGGSIGVRLFSSISSSSSAENFSVQLNCNIPGKEPVVYVVASNAASNVIFPVPSDFYGLSCSLAILDSGDFAPVNSLVLSVTQAPAIAFPGRAASFLVGNPVQVLLTLNLPLGLAWVLHSKRHFRLPRKLVALTI
jgi:hypothetical protein